MNILIAGGLGYIGAILSSQLLKYNHKVVIVDNLSNVPEGLSKINTIRKSVSDHQKHNLEFYELDIAKDVDDLEDAFIGNDIDVIINLAASKSVEQGELYPMRLIQNNVNIQTNLCMMAENYNVKYFMFASTATVYNETNELPFKEDAEIDMLNICNYGYSKAVCEEILSKFDLKYFIFRFFNVIGTSEYHELGDSGSNNIVPKLLNCSKTGNSFSIYGNDYDTKDGTAERDYVDVKDIVKAFTIVIDKIENEPGFIEMMHDTTFNIGTGKSYSVQQVVDTYNSLVDDEDYVNFSYSDKRKGDMPKHQCYTGKLQSRFSFSPEIPLEESLRDAYIYYKRNFKESSDDK